ncbi:hypothetical protein ARAM_000093 [Aspergillus rambellii]|uniref:non-reducing end alpha-L-arabinofuranosidase n=1 Tax=Aspergillus rambellii TaxID=308745 RepID=A0A0F8WT05_9EURO|nr:hypothetical protein ARAM_000093 [Aspergillus rambellii]
MKVLETVVRLLVSWAGLGWRLGDASSVGKRDGPSDADSVVYVTVVSEGGNQSSALLYGIMFEEMDHSGDGGIHGQLLRNNGFQGSDPGLAAYNPIGAVEIMQDSLSPVTDAIRSSLAVSPQSNATGYVGFANTGYNGVPVTNATYRSEFWMMGDYSGPITLQLVGSSSGRVYASHNMTVDSSWGNFSRHEATFNSTASTDADNEWRLLFDSSLVRGGALNFGLVQLFAPTYNSRYNGLREDIASLVADIQPSFLRFPGGNNLEGLQINNRWQWNLTIGPVVERPGRDSDWFYPNTDALGLDEYLWWCEDLGMVPVLAVWAGKSYGGILSGDDLQPYVTDILNELEYLLGSNDTHYGSLRAQNGRETPWPIQYIEIGNEDDFTGGCETYPDRFTQIYDAIHAKYPQLTLIASTTDDLCLPEELPPGIMFDFHYYRNPDDLVGMFNQWDNQPRSQPVIVGEYGCRNTSDPDGVFWSFMQASCSEAVHMIGLERNSDVVKMAAYAPLLQHFGFTQWSPTLIGFDSSPGSLTPSTSYFVQKMFSTNQGTTVHAMNSTAGFGPLYWVATSTNATYQVKLANYGADDQAVHVRVPGTKAGRLEMLSGPKEASNLPHNVTITPVVTDITGDRETYTFRMPPWGVAILVVS